MIERFNIDEGVERDWVSDGECIYFNDLPYFIRQYVTNGELIINDFDLFLKSFKAFVEDFSTYDKERLIELIKSTM